MRANVLIIEGHDKSGKDSIRLALDKKFNYEFINVVRGPIGYEAYNRMFKKHQDSKAFKETAKRMDEFSVTVFLDVDEETLKRRMISTGEVVHDCPLDADPFKVAYARKEFYKGVVEEAESVWGLKNVHVIDNNGTIEEAVEKISSLLENR